MITSKNKSNFKNSVLVLDDMGDKLNKAIVYYFSEGRHYNIQMIVMCHKPAQIINTARVVILFIKQLIMELIYLKILMKYINVNITSIK